MLASGTVNSAKQWIKSSSDLLVLQGCVNCSYRDARM
jgi:hypothetical protein